MSSRVAATSATVLTVLGLSLAACILFPSHVGSWLRGARSAPVKHRSGAHMSAAQRVLMAADEDHPLVFEEALLRNRPLPSELLATPAESVATRQLTGAMDRYTWKLQNEKAGFSARYAHAAVLNVRQEIFVLGGAVSDMSAGGGNGYLNDVWVSEDHGRSWRRVTPRTAKFTPRRGHAAVMNSNQLVMFVLGGFCGKDCFMNDWWSSESGGVWTKLVPAPWSPRHGHAVVMTSKENLILMGGHDGTSYLNDIWSMLDPEQAGESAWVNVRRISLGDGSDDPSGFSPRYGHAVVINSQDEIYVMGGFFADKKAGKVLCFADVWVSQDEGYTWTQVTELAPWTGRYQHSAVVNAMDEVFIIGGLNSDLERCNDVWRSKDSGVTWNEVTPAAPWAARYEHASVIDRNSSVYVIGGMSTSADKFHDVWRSERTCADDMECPGEDVVCRDGTNTNFHGLPNPICVFICDRRIFDDCQAKEACRVKHSKATCIDPCDEQACKGDGEVCEVYARDSELHGVLLEDSEAYCLSCGDSRTKFACDKLRQCTWSPGAEACLMRCDVAMTEDKCNSIGGSCKWGGGKCK